MTDQPKAPEPNATQPLGGQSQPQPPGQQSGEQPGQQHAEQPAEQPGQQPAEQLAQEPAQQPTAQQPTAQQPTAQQPVPQPPVGPYPSHPYPGQAPGQPPSWAATPPPGYAPPSGFGAYPAAAPPPGFGAYPAAAAPYGNAPSSGFGARLRRPRTLPTIALITIGAALLVVGGVIGALIGHNAGHDDLERAGDGRPFRDSRVLPGGPGWGPGQQDRQGPQDRGEGWPLPRGAGFTVGTVTAVDGSTVTIRQPDGRTVQVEVTDSTAITVTKEGSASDITVGEQVLATGRAAADGTVTARSLRVGDLPGRTGGAQG